ncbi:PREDICTED: DNA-binding protein BIN4-like isoform X2 [Populus euphratica]|uniref:DNA-binding protein BIN4-like isoform X2 n=1 Tax=Populus euphratica TaxID=75702 RepID=A0AAJ6T2X9_POPEU|nr:PREDICTED: DNA-binding protein BIN4-like isoform X2 [Populus euphratica]
MVDTVPSLVISLRYGDGDDGQDIEDGTSAKHTEEPHETMVMWKLLRKSHLRSLSMLMFLHQGYHWCFLRKSRVPRHLLSVKVNPLIEVVKMGAVGRPVIPDTPSGDSEMHLDLKGTIYRTTTVPSRAFYVVQVSFGQSKAKIEATMNDFIQLKTQSNVYETTVEGTLGGVFFLL